MGGQEHGKRNKGKKSKAYRDFAEFENVQFEGDWRRELRRLRREVREKPSVDAVIESEPEQELVYSPETKE